MSVLDHTRCDFSNAMLRSYYYIIIVTIILLLLLLYIIHDFLKFEVFLVFYRAYKHILSKYTSPTSGGSYPALNAPLHMHNINEYDINIIKIIMQ